MQSKFKKMSAADYYAIIMWCNENIRVYENASNMNFNIESSEAKKIEDEVRELISIRTIASINLSKEAYGFHLWCLENRK